MADKDVLGRAGEDRAARYLEDQGYRILDRNWRCREGELDLIAATATEIVVVEVKTRRDDSFGHPFEAVDARKRARLWRLTAAWMSANPALLQGRRLRIDAIGITGPDPATAHARAHRRRGGAMTIARTWSVALVGVEGEPVEVEADLSKQTPDFKIIGLPDKALGEAVQRVHNACANSGLHLPRRRLTVNLSPASLPKHGSGFDVAIAIASLATEVPMDVASVAATVHLGELGLDGRLRPIPGILPAVLSAARAGLRRVVVPAREPRPRRSSSAGSRCSAP